MNKINLTVKNIFSVAIVLVMFLLNSGQVLADVGISGVVGGGGGGGGGSGGNGKNTGADTPTIPSADQSTDVFHQNFYDLVVLKNQTNNPIQSDTYIKQLPEAEESLLGDVSTKDGKTLPSNLEERNCNDKLFLYTPEKEKRMTNIENVFSKNSQNVFSNTDDTRSISNTWLLLCDHVGNNIYGFAQNGLTLLQNYTLKINPFKIGSGETISFFGGLVYLPYSWLLENNTFGSKTTDRFKETSMNVGEAFLRFLVQNFGTVAKLKTAHPEWLVPQPKPESPVAQSIQQETKPAEQKPSFLFFAKQSIEKIKNPFMEFALFLTRSTVSKNPKTYLGRDFAYRGGTTITIKGDVIIAKVPSTKNLENTQVFSGPEKVTVISYLSGQKYAVAFTFTKEQLKQLSEPSKSCSETIGCAEALKIAIDSQNGFGIVSLSDLFNRATVKSAADQSVFNKTNLPELLEKRFHPQRKLESFSPTKQYSLDESGQIQITACIGKPFRLSKEGELVC